MNRGIPADAIRTDIGARVDVASRLSIPVQRLDSGRHTISAGLGRSPRGLRSRVVVGPARPTRSCEPRGLPRVKKEETTDPEAENKP
jgi:hypothetical protein